MRRVGAFLNRVKRALSGSSRAAAHRHHCRGNCGTGAVPPPESAEPVEDSGDEAPPSPVLTAEEEAEKKILLNKVRSILNRITHGTLARLLIEFFNLKVYQTPWMVDVIVQIFDKAVDDVKFRGLYSIILIWEIKEELETNNNFAPFNRVLREQADAELAFIVYGDADGRNKMPSIEEFDGDTEAFEQRLEDRRIFRKRKFAMIIFLANLHFAKVMTAAFTNYCLKGLLETVAKQPENLEGYSADDEEVECAVRLIDTLGATMSRLNSEALLDGSDPPFNLSVAFETLERAKPIVSNRVKFLIMDLEDRYKNGWVKPTRAGDGTGIAI